MLTKDELARALRGVAYVAQDEIEPFCRYAAQAPDTLVEIGAGWGASAVLMLISAPETAIVTSIDPFTGDTMRPDRRSSEELCDRLVREALETVGHSAAYLRWRLSPMTSLKAAEGWRAPIDFLYIDGDHRYEATRADFEAWLPHVRDGGVILLHDSRRVGGAPAIAFARGWPGPTRLAEELLADEQVERIEEAFSLTIWRKPQEANS